MKIISTITHSKRPLIKKFAFSLFILVISCTFSSCQSDNKAQKEPQAGVVVKDFKTYPIKQFATSSGRLIKAYLAKTNLEQTQGLSGIKESELADNEGMIFWYESTGPRRFWMPNTFTNLDIFFLDKNFLVIHIERNVQAHPGIKEPPAIARTPVVYAHHVLELKASSSLAKEIQKGSQLKVLN